MKPLLAGILLLVGFSDAAQEPAATKPTRERFACLLTGVKPKQLLKCQSTQDAVWAPPELQEAQRGFREFARTAKPGMPWSGTGDPVVFIFEADSIESDGADLRLKGNAEIDTVTMVLHADEAVYHRTTHEIEASGSLKMKIQ